MADLSVTAANVKLGTGALINTGVAGGTITAGQPVYADSEDGNKLKVCDANASLQTSVAVGIAVHGASNNQPLQYVYAGKINLGATVAVGTIYVVSGTAGGIAPTTDLVSTWYTTVLGVGLVATGDNSFLVSVVTSRVAVP